MTILATCFGFFIKPSSGCYYKRRFDIKLAMCLKYEILFKLEYEIENVKYNYKKTLVYRDMLK